ncbi:hypothetical protein KEH51_10855 [[Brevibacterium] frigoritolerans]|uniref:Uncharacterized protein n=1 Tax=Peribacillus frigoritolerans TaxID=450367 RepID=A0A941FHB5_9BACI|nr:hypothetical protein [Peribacillus frigoritolerans]
MFGAILAGAIPFKKYRTILLKISLIISILTTALMGLSYSHLLWNGLLLSIRGCQCVCVGLSLRYRVR